MDIRNVQKTGNMFYIYLPTNWCKKRNIKRASKVSIEEANDGSLVIHPQVVENKKTHLSINLGSLKQKLNTRIINKFIVAAYINPADSFVIHLPNKMDMLNVFDQKKLLNIEFVDFDRQHISCESPMRIEEPYLLLKTMIKKIKSMLYVMTNNYHKELIEKYEDEIDKSKLLIEKSVVSSMISYKTPIKPITLHYIGIIAKELEIMVDYTKELDKKQKQFFDKIGSFLSELQELLENIENKRIDFGAVISLFLKCDRARAKKSSYYKSRISSSMIIISETIIDWLVTNYILEQKHG